MATGEEKVDANKLFQEMYQKQLVPQAAIPKWEEFGIELGFLYGEIDTISGNAADKAVERCSKEMLQAWRQQLGSAATPDKLIAALQNIEQNSYAAQLQNALDRGTFETEYPYHKIARSIAPYWDNVAIQLGVDHWNNIKLTNDPTSHKFNEMLQRWLHKQTCSKREIYVKIYEALKGIELNAAAEEFRKKAL